MGSDKKDQQEGGEGRDLEPILPFSSRFISPGFFFLLLNSIDPLTPQSDQKLMFIHSSEQSVWKISLKELNMNQVRNMTVKIARLPLRPSSLPSVLAILDITETLRRFQPLAGILDAKSLCL